MTDRARGHVSRRTARQGGERAVYAPAHELRARRRRRRPVASPRDGVHRPGRRAPRVDDGRGRGCRRAGGRRARRPRRPARRRRDDARRQPARVGDRHGRLLPARRGGAAVHRAAPRRATCATASPSPRRASSSATSATRASSPPPTPDCDVLLVPGPRAHGRRAAPRAVELGPDDPCLVAFTSGTSGAPKAVLHGQRYLRGQQLQAEHWLDAREDELVWCTAATGWSKSARNAFIAPWLRGAAALLHDARFDPAERLELVERERVDVLCMAPTEYRVIAARGGLRPLPGLRGLVAAGEALDAGVLHAWHEATGLWVRDGYGQTETGQLTGMPPGSRRGRARWAARCRASASTSWRASSCSTRRTDPTFFLRYLGGPPHDGPVADGRPRPCRRGRLPVLRGPRRRRDHLRRLPHRAVRGRVGARGPSRGRGGGRGGSAGRRAGERRPRRRRRQRRLRARRTTWSASCRTT